MIPAEAFLLNLKDGQCIVPSNVCTESQLVEARADGRMFVAPSAEQWGYGFVILGVHEARASLPDAPRCSLTEV